MSSNVKHLIKGVLLTVLLPAAVAAAGAFDGGRRASHDLALAHVTPQEAPPEDDKTPRETFTLTPIVMTVADPAPASKGKAAEAKTKKATRRVKVQVAVELARGLSREDFEPFVPRTRHAILTTLSRLDAGTLSRIAGREKTREELRDAIHAVGVTQVQKVLFTEFWVM